MNFADGQRLTCRLQIFSLPSANETFAIGKCLAGRRQISYRIHGKYKFCNRQIVILLNGNFFAGGKLREQTKGLRLEVRKKQALVQTQQHAAESAHEKQVRARVLDRMRRA